MPVHQLPMLPTSFIGRNDELAQIAALLAAPDCRLLTLTGPGGMGKTRLAIEAAHQIVLPNGVYFAPFQPLTSPGLMLAAIADVVGFRFSPGSDTRQQLLDYLHDKSMLLVLDNLEHLLDGVNLLSDVLAAAPNLQMLVTSRERLNLLEEWVLDVSGLDYPPDSKNAKIEKYDAVRLFVQNARRAQVDFSLDSARKVAVTRICRLTEGMPLGIELAAGWVRVLTCQQIADEIERSLDILETPTRNVEPRHRTMRAVFEPTWNHLPDEARGVFSKLSVFRGGFTRQAAEYVAGASLWTLSLLVDRSLLRVDNDGRYDLHELLRQYAGERLNQSPDEHRQTHERHCRCYASFLEQCWSRLTGSDIKLALTDIEKELDNVRSAWEWAVQHSQAREIEASLNSLWFFYDQGNRYYEGEQVFARAASTLKPSLPEQEGLWAKVLARHGALCRLVLLRTQSYALLGQSVEVLRRIPACADLAFALTRLAVVTPEAKTGITCLQESLTIYAELDDHWGRGQVLDWLCVFYIEESFQQDRSTNLSRARQYALEGLEANQKIASPYGLAQSYMSLGKIAYCLEDYAMASDYFHKSLDLFQDVGIFWGILYTLHCLGYSACILGEYAHARSFSLRGLQMAYDQHLSSNLQYVFPLLTVVAEIWLKEDETQRAYELLALVDQWRRNSGFSRAHIEFRSLLLLDEELPPYLAAAVARGRAADIDAVIKNTLYELNQSVENPITPLLSSPPADPISVRELEILRLLADGLNSREIANQLVLSVGTIRWYLKQIYSKLDVHSRSQAIARARELELLA
jgi:predicted ATPase/DNA-binding CsgD family transcriptional regulator